MYETIKNASALTLFKKNDEARKDFLNYIKQSGYNIKDENIIFESTDKGTFNIKINTSIEINIGPDTDIRSK
ncbi:MAG: hypothetical protein MJZ34_11340 [Paludibacteraceae bacterium]|nr:hypothetical protein [Paludibacteraceae bacterium]